MQILDNRANNDFFCANTEIFFADSNGQWALVLARANQTSRRKKGDGNYEWSLVNINSPPYPIPRNPLHLLDHFLPAAKPRRSMDDKPPPP